MTGDFTQKFMRTDDSTGITNWMETYLDGDKFYVETGYVARWRQSSTTWFELSVGEAKMLKEQLAEFIKQNGG